MSKNKAYFNGLWEHPKKNKEEILTILYSMCFGLAKKLVRHNPQIDWEAIATSAYIKTQGKLSKFNKTKSDNPYGYFYRVITNNIYKGWNKEKPKTIIQSNVDWNSIEYSTKDSISRKW